MYQAVIPVVDTILAPAVVLLKNVASPNAEALGYVVSIVTAIIPPWIVVLNPLIVLTTVRVYRRAVLDSLRLWPCV